MRGLRRLGSYVISLALWSVTPTVTSGSMVPWLPDDSQLRTSGKRALGWQTVVFLLVTKMPVTWESARQGLRVRREFVERVNEYAGHYSEVKDEWLLFGHCQAICARVSSHHPKIQ